MSEMHYPHSSISQERGISGESRERAAAEAQKTTRRGFLKRALANAVVGGIAIEAMHDRISQGVRGIQQKSSPSETMSATAQSIEETKSNHPEVDQWADPERWAQAIEKECEKQGLPLSSENISIIMTIIRAESGFRTSPRSIDRIPSPSEKSLADLGLSRPRTGGPMQVSYDSVGPEMRTSVDSIEGGIAAGVSQLKTIIGTYNSVQDEQLRLSCIFADYNAGRFACRNAGLQRALNELGALRLREDGLLGGQTIRAISELARSRNESLSEEQIRQDMERSNTEALKQTETWQCIERLHGTSIAPVVANRPVLGVYGLLRQVLGSTTSSEQYAATRQEEYRKIHTIVANQMDGLKVRFAQN